MPETFDGLVTFRNESGDTIVIIDPDAALAPIRLLDTSGNALLEITFDAELRVGGGDEAGDVSLRLGNGDETVRLSAERATIEAGGNSEAGLFILRNAVGEIVVRGQAADGSLVAGGHGVNGVLTLNRANVTQIGNFNEAVIHADAESGTLILRDNASHETVRLDGSTGDITARRYRIRQADLRLGAVDDDGDIALFPGANASIENPTVDPSIHLDGSTGDITARRYRIRQADLRLGAVDDDGDIALFPGANASIENPTVDPSIHLDGSTGDITARRYRIRQADLRLGAVDDDGDIALFPRSNASIENPTVDPSIHLDGSTGDITARRYRVRQADLRLGAVDDDGDIALFPGANASIENPTVDPSIHLDGSTGDITARRYRIRQADLRLGAVDDDGDIALFPGANASIENPTVDPSIHLDGSTGDITARRYRIRQADLRLGAVDDDGDIALFPGANASIENPTVDPSIHLNGGTGDITLRNADLAEDFDIDAASAAEPGTVMCLDASGRLVACDAVGDTRLVGVISGLDTRPGMILDRRPETPHRAPVALVGKVGVKVDARVQSIAPGDLLTTAELAGHACRAAPDTPQGAILGKAMTGLPAGETGVILMLVHML